MNSHTAVFSTAGPIGGAVGGVVGAVAAVVGYDVYLSEHVKGAAEYLLGGKEPDYVELARAVRREFLLRKHQFETLVLEKASLSREGYFERSAVEVSLGMSAADTQALLEEARRQGEADGKPLIPMDCAIALTVRNDKNPAESETAIYTISGGRVTSRSPDLVQPAEDIRATKGYKREEIRTTRRFEGSLVAPNVIVGQAIWKTGPWQSWSWNPEGKLVYHRVSSMVSTYNVRIEFNPGGSASWTSHVTHVLEYRVIVGNPAPPKTITDTLRGKGMWQFANERLEGRGGPAPGASSRIEAGRN